MNKHIRIIPRLDIKGPNVVKGIFTEGLRVVGNPIELARRYYREGADELIYMDIVASLYQRNIDFELLRSVAREVFVPVTAGGGIRSVGDIENALRAGADKITINTYAIAHPEFLKEAAERFGSQCIVLSVEAKRTSAGGWEAYTDGGREHTGTDAITWIRRAIDLGVGEVMLTSIDHEGTRRGYDDMLIRKVANFCPVPLIAHGGAGKRESFQEILEAGRPDALAAATVFHYGDMTIKEVKHFLAQRNIPVRPS